MDRDGRYMRVAIGLAKKAEGLTSPNPIVGAIIVKNDVIVGRGCHERAGLPHAEINALRSAGRKAKAATLYVTLEPCDHFGRTPPCTESIIESGIRKVVIAMKDPNPLNNGRGVRRLIRGGIRVKLGVLEDEARLINRPYIKFITKGMPYVTVKLAESLDGKIATRKGDSRWITGDDSRRYVHRLRRRVDAVMVGANTVIKDDPLLISKASGGRQPTRIVIDAALKVPARSRVFRKFLGVSPVVIATTTRSRINKRAIFERRGIRVLVAASKAGRVDLRRLLKALAGMDISNILVEGGGELAASLLEERLADRVLVFIAPKIIGGKDAITSVEGIGAAAVKDAVSLKDVKIRRFSEDILIEARTNRCSQG